MIEVHLLRYALAAAETGSFSRAADRFRVKQTTLSKRVRHLELRLGLTLFERSTQGVAPTDIGLNFLSKARAILKDLDALSDETTALARGTAGTLRLGFHGSLSAGDLRAGLEAYRRAFPAVELEIMEAGREALLAAIDRDRLDIAFVAGSLNEPGRRSLCLWTEPISIAMAAGHAMAARDPLYWTDLRGIIFLVTESDPGSLIGAMVTARLSGHGHAPAIRQHAVGRENLLSLVSGEQMAVVSGIVPDDQDGVAIRQVHDAFGPTRIDQTMSWRESSANPALSGFLKLMTERYGRPASVSG